jgi:hypothetical protein
MSKKMFEELTEKLSSTGKTYMELARVVKVGITFNSLGVNNLNQ